jgi:hypothetical protein
MGSGNSLLCHNEEDEKYSMFKINTVHLQCLENILQQQASNRRQRMRRKLSCIRRLSPHLSAKQCNGGQPQAIMYCLMQPNNVLKQCGSHLYVDPMVFYQELLLPCYIC